LEGEEKILVNYTCKICGNTENNLIYVVKEMQFGTRDKFNYCQCSNCFCLQIIDTPKNLTDYYPNNYFSFQKERTFFLKEWLNTKRDKYVFGQKNYIGKILYKIYGEPTYSNWLNNLNINFKSKILDVGCGSGSLLYRMGNAGFKKVMGIDPFINESIEYKNGVKIHKKNLFELNEKYDLIMMHHSLEHLPNQIEIFEKLNQLLNKKGYLLIRIPICSSKAWEKFREDWFALEAPRHFFIHSEKSINLIANKCGFKLKKVTYDSRSIQFWGSIQYQKDIPLMAENSYFIDPKKSIFTKDEIIEFENETIRLNINGGADQAVLYFEKMN